MALTKATFSMINGEIASIRDFGAVGDGVTDDTAALTAFFNHANANPGVRHFMDPLVYRVTELLPDINVSDVWIEGAGTEIHDTGTVLTGTILRWAGPSGTAGPLVNITAVSGAGNQRISGVNFIGIGIDCNVGGLTYGMEIKSARFCNIEVSIINAALVGLQLGVVDTLGEGKDLQRCNILLNSRQIEAPDGFGLVLGGDDFSNVSMNRFQVDAQIANIQSIFCINSDNNQWDFVRVFKVPSGTATEGVSLLGGNVNVSKARAEVFNYYTANVPIHVYGTSGFPTYLFPSVGNVCFLDKDNGTPDPTIEDGGEIGIMYNTTELSENAWVSYTPTISATSGTITAYTAEGKYIKRGKLITVTVNVDISDNGTGAGEIMVSLPAATVGMTLGGTLLPGRERRIINAALTAYIESGSSFAEVMTYNALYPGGTDAAITFAGSYEIVG
jgi:hypothetical protein